jgi:hypothetical protein
MFTCEAVLVIAGGCVMVNDCVPVQPPAPVTVQVYVPGHNPVALDPDPPEGAHEYVKGPVPETIVTVAEPLQLPLQVTSVCAPDVVIVPPVVPTVIAAVEVPQLDVTVTVYVPAQRFDAEDPVPPEGDQL